MATSRCCGPGDQLRHLRLCAFRCLGRPAGQRLRAGAQTGRQCRLASRFTSRLATHAMPRRLPGFTTRASPIESPPLRPQPRSAAQVVQQLEQKGDRFPTVVVGELPVVAWASVGPYRTTPCYEGIGEHSVYVDRAARGQGAGLVALDALCAACADRGYWKLISRIFPENEPVCGCMSGRDFGWLASTSGMPGSMANGAIASSSKS